MKNFVALIGMTVPALLVAKHHTVLALVVGLPLVVLYLWLCDKAREKVQG